MTTMPPDGSLQDHLIASQLPTWLSGVSPESFSALNRSLSQQMQAEHEVQTVYKGITPLDVFAVSRLQQKLLDLHQLSVDVRTAQIRFKVVLPAALAKLLGKPVERYFQHTLLEAALHNFSASEASSMPGAQILHADGTPLPLAPEVFAALCRSLDIGQQYQNFLKAQLCAPGGEGQQVNLVIEQSQRASLEATARVAELKGEIDKHFLDLLLPVISATAETGTVIEDATEAHLDRPVLVAKAWRVLGRKVRGALAFEVHRAGAMEGVLCWVPGDAQGALCWYESWNVFFATLGKMFRLPGYDRFFQRFIGERDRMAFTLALEKAKASREAHLPVALDGRYESITQPVFAHMRQEQVDTLLDNALLLAAPTADRDSVERDQRLHFYLDAGLSALGLASLFVPWLGLPLLAVMAYDVVDGLYEGYADWQLGDRQAALEHVLGAAEAAALVGVGVGAGVAAQRLLKSADMVRRLVPVPVNESQFRLIHPDLPGYEVLDDSLAVGERAGEPGHERLRTHGATYHVAQDPLTTQLSIQHPTRSGAYAPLLEQNGAGAWRHEFESPQQWQEEAMLFRRLGSDLNDIPAQTIHDVLQATGFNDDHLRRLHLENAAAPARLLDALQRYQLHQQEPALQGDAFESRLSQQAGEPTAVQRLLQQAFPNLSVRGAREIVEGAEPRRLQQMVSQQKVPMSLAGKARWFLRDSRIDRACAGLRQTAAINADTERLALGLSADLAPWPEAVRVELRDDRGAVVARAGADSATQVRVISRVGAGYMAYDMAGRLLTNDTLGDNLFKALLSQMDDQQKSALSPTGQLPVSLSDVLGQRAFEQREKVAELIGMQPVSSRLKPGFKQADGQLGIPLSGGAGKQLGKEDLPEQLDDREAYPDTLEEGLRRLFPARDEDTVQSYLSALRHNEANSPWPAYRELVRQVRALRRSLSIWRGHDAERTRVAQAIFDAWQPELNGETPAFSLDLDGQIPGGLPEFSSSVQWGRLTHLTLRNIDLAQFDGTLPARLGGVRHLGLVDSALTSLPDWLFNLDQLEELSLRNNQLSSLPEGITRLGRLTHLDLANNQLTAIPEVAGRLGSLRTLSLDNNRVVVDALGRVRLARLRRLEVLILSNNPASDLRGLPNNIALQRVSLRFSGLTEFPVQLVRQHPRIHLALEGNNIVELNDEAVGLVRRAGAQIQLDYNPLSPGVRRRLAALDRQRALQIRQGPYPADEPVTGDNRWLVGLRGDELIRRRAQWQRLEGQPGSLPLRAFLEDLAHSAEFTRNPQTTQARIWDLLDACELNEGVGQAVFATADSHFAFADQRLQLLSQLETRVMLVQRLAGVVPARVERVYLDFGRGIYRLDQLDRISFDHMRRLEERGDEPDDVEVTLAYRYGLHDRLALPVRINRMYYRQIAQVSAADIERARVQVLAGENVQTLSESLATRDFWQAYLRAHDARPFDALNDAFTHRLEDLETQGLGEHEFALQAGTLAAERNVRLNDLYVQLTREAYQNAQPR